MSVDRSDLGVAGSNAPPRGAVFLSYASQDAAAVRAICDALRAAGVEVWFDQNELVGGDAWDAKIRRQISECALFVPVVSANTQARLEGYFRLEWKLAAQRTHMMAEERAFLLPVVIDDTRDSDAKVPAEFKAVQWTRLPPSPGLRRTGRQADGGRARLVGEREPEDPAIAALVTRVQRLLAAPDSAAGVAPIAGVADPGARVADEVPSGQAFARPAAAAPMVAGARRRRVGWMIGTAAALVVLVPLALWLGRRGDSSAAAVSASVASRPLSEARQLALRARDLSLDKYNSTADDFAAAEGLLRRALELDPNDSEILAVASQFNTSIRTRGFDHSPARRETARSQAERALKLAPDSLEALFALGRIQRDGDPDPAVAERTFRAVLARDPQHGGALSNLGTIYTRTGREEEAIAMFERCGRQPRWRPLARYQEYLLHFGRGKFDEAERCLRESIAAEPSSNAVTGLAMVLLTARGDARAAVEALRQMPAASRQEHRAVWMSAFAHLAEREPEAALTELRRLSAEYVQDNWFVGPREYWVGRAHAQAGRMQAARAAFEAGLAVMEPRVRQAPGDPELRVAQGELLAWLGRTEEARQAALTARELARSPETRFWFFSPVRIYAVLGDAGAAVPMLERLMTGEGRALQWPLTPALLRVDPLWDQLRGDPRFARLAADGAPPGAATLSVPDKSVAVLPFSNRNAGTEEQFFVDGVQDELRNTLAAIRELTVVSGLSVERYRGTTKTYRQVGAELGVAYVLEGSVQRSGSRVRITGRLIDARREAQVWSKSLEREVRDVFAIQAELATGIAGELRAVLSSEEKKLVAQRPTESEEAYELYLRARAATRGDRDWGLMLKAQEWLQTAVNLDPRFAPAWLELSQLHGHFYSSFRDRSESRLAKAAAALEEAKRIVPDSPEVLRATASYHHAAGDQAPAEELFGQFVRRQPNDSEAYDALGRVAMRRGRWAESVAYLRRAVQLDPGNVVALKWLAHTLSLGRRYEEAEATYRRALTLVTPDLDDQFYVADLSYRATGSTAAVDRLLAGLSPEDAASRKGLQLRFRWAAMRGDHEQCLRILDQDQRFPGPHAETIWAFLQRGDIARARHRASLAVAERRRRLEAEPRNAQQWGMMGQYEAMVGNREPALEHARRAVELDPIAKDAYTGTNRLWQQAFVYAWTGDKERALEALARLIRMPHPEMNVHVMRRSFLFEPLRGDPRFQALLDDPRNNAPLF